MFECRELKKSYKETVAVNSLSFTVNKGEVFAFLGGNGAGKTTTIKMILGLVKPDEGKIVKAPDLKLGYSPETPYFPPFLSGREVLRYYGRVQKINKKDLEKEIDRLLLKVGLDDTKTKVRNYSKGMLQRLALAQALLGDPDMLILDEPTAGLDAVGRLEMIRIIAELKQSGKTILINSHILNDIEQICDRGLIIKKGVQLRAWDKYKPEDTDIKEDGSVKSLEEIFLEVIGGKNNGDC